MIMKNLNLKLIPGTLILSLFLFGCKKDDDDNGNANSFKFDGKTYALAKGFFEEYGPNGDGNSADFDIILMSSSFVFNETEGEFTGTGDAVYIDLNSPSLTEISSGTYVYDDEYYYSEEATRQPNTFVEGGVFIGYNVQSETGTVFETDENSSGTVTINTSGSSFEISFNFTLSNGKRLEGQYKGTLQLLDYIKKSGTPNKIKNSKF
jgi:hypothetical protein